MKSTQVPSHTPILPLTPIPSLRVLRRTRTNCKTACAPSWCVQHLTCMLECISCFPVSLVPFPRGQRYHWLSEPLGPTLNVDCNVDCSNKTNSSIKDRSRFWKQTIQRPLQHKRRGSPGFAGFGVMSVMPTRDRTFYRTIKLTVFNWFHDTTCAQVVVSLNGGTSTVPDTTVRFASPVEAGSLLVESGLHFSGWLDIDVSVA